MDRMWRPRDSMKLTLEDQRCWEGFEKAGMIGFINKVLSPFGWALIIVYNSHPLGSGRGSLKGVYPIRLPQKE